jgi:hypothetical protein
VADIAGWSAVYVSGVSGFRCYAPSSSGASTIATQSTPVAFSVGDRLTASGSYEAA